MIEPNLMEADARLQEVERAAGRARLAINAAEGAQDSGMRRDALVALAEGAADGLDASRELLKLVRLDGR